MIEIMDTTLRDGEQTSGVSFSVQEKFSLAKMLLADVKVDRIEVASAMVSKGEQVAVRKIANWAKTQHIPERVEVLGFVDHKSVDWISRAGAKVINLLAKGSMKHCELQLKKSAKEHFESIGQTVTYARSKGFIVNVYLEDWSGGMRESSDYVMQLVALLKDLGVKRVMLPDTLGILSPHETEKYISTMVEKFPGTWFDFHAHNDYGLATANSLAAIRAGAKGIHTTVNNMGERTGNASLPEVCVSLKDLYNKETAIDESKLKALSKAVEVLSGRRMPPSAPIVGDDVFTQTAGIHADGDRKGNLYANKLTPERFSRKREYALGKLSGKASLEMNLKELGIELDAEQMKLVLKKIVDLGDRKKIVTKEDLPFIISDILKSPQEKRILIKDYEITSDAKDKPRAMVLISIDGKLFERKASGDGGYDAFMNCIDKLKEKLSFDLPELIDYSVTIPPGGKTNALVNTTITWKNDREFRTTGVDSDQVVAAIQATQKMLNLMAIDQL